MPSDTVEEESIHLFILTDEGIPSDSASAIREWAASNNIVVEVLDLSQFRQVGSYVTYGAYEQDGDESNGKEPVEWLVPDYDESTNRVLLISRYGLDAKPYNAEYTDVTWETCTLRTWLNGEFLNAAVSAEEQKAIPTVTVDNSSGQCFDWVSVGWASVNPNGGNDTQDRIFLLSYAEANKYYELTFTNTASRVEPTAYALKQGAYLFEDEDCKTADGRYSGAWWLRSPGFYQGYAMEVQANGSKYARRVDLDSRVVRPAFWLDLSGIWDPQI